MQLLRSGRADEALDATATMYPARLRVLEGEHELSEPTSTYYGVVVAGHARIAHPALEANAPAGGFFALPGRARLFAQGLTVVIERLGFRGLPLVGAIEDQGRLAYVDGCSDSVLVAPPRAGDPVLNHLHFPAATEQRVHRHPSIRLGVVVRGRGEAHGPSADGPEWTEALEPGTAFLLAAHERHAFRTAPGSSLDIVAFHPDSDWGPTDQAHPMINRTLVG